MIQTQVNPAWANAAAYVEFLNRGFQGQWDRRSFEWYLRREFHGWPTDIAVRAEDCRIYAAAAYCYRQLVDPSGRCIDVCVMAAGATLPSQRRHGHYSALLQTGLDLCRERSCAAILGFTTRDNASGRGLTRLGAYSIPTFYIMSDGRGRAPRGVRRRPPRLLRPVEGALKVPDKHIGYAQFHYADRQDWLNQFVHRPNPVRAWRVSHDAIALIETVGATDRLQWYGGPDGRTVSDIAALAEAAAAAHRKFFMFTLDPLLADSSKRLGLKVRGGYLKILPVDRAKDPLDELARSPWRLHSGDRM